MMSGKSDEQAPAAARGKADTSGEFFSVGTPLHAVRAGYIRRRADDLLHEALVAGRYTHVIAPDRSGKSSLITATAAQLENNGVNVAILDLEQIGIRDVGKDAGRWYYSVAYRLLRQLRIRYDLQSWWQDKSVLSNRQRLLEFYAEVILQHVQERIVIFVDEIQCIGQLPFADQLLASIRSAHNARATDPDFSRLTFVLIGECDPSSLIDVPELSPFNVTQAIPLDDFTRRDLVLFGTELNLAPDDARTALDRIYYWTRGQPYLSQKLARAVAREDVTGDIAGNVDRIVMHQLAGRAALHSEPHMSHIHREVVDRGRQSEALLNLYGRLRKGVEVITDMGSPLQRQLMAIGLVEIDEQGHLCIRNRIYETVFTARWANENLPTHWRVPAVAAAVLLIIVAIPLWYTQWLPNSYVDVLTSASVDLQTAETTWLNLRSFPGHAVGADNLYRSFLEGRARHAADETSIKTVSDLAAAIPDSGRLPQQLQAEFWDRRAGEAMRTEQRDTALLASLESLVLSTPQRRHRAAMLIGEDYPLLIAALPPGQLGDIVFDSANLLVTTINGAQVSQWSLSSQALQRGDDWTMTAIEVTPLLRRVIVDRDGQVRRLGLTITLSHPRLADLRVKLIAPSGRAVEVDTGLERVSSNEDIRIPEAQLRELIGEPLSGTWSLSIRDEVLGVAGHLVGWNLTLNAQGLVEDFQRGLDIPDPVERETDNIWTSSDGRYAVARAMQSDSARVWDLAAGKPIRAIAVNENEKLIGLDAGARRLVTATLDTVNLWDMTTGGRVASMPVGAASMTSRLTTDGAHLFVQRGSDTETRLELWSLDGAAIESELVVAGTPALVALNAAGTRAAIADYDRAVRIWDFADATLRAQVDLAIQPSAISLGAGGDVLGVVYGNEGVALWQVDRPQAPLLEKFGRGKWQLAFSPSGTSFIAGRPGAGYQVHRSSDGHLIGPAIGADSQRPSDGLLAFSRDEKTILTSGAGRAARFWRVPTAPTPLAAASGDTSHAIWAPTADAVVAATPDASIVVIGDRSGHLHMLHRSELESLAVASEDVSFIGHTAAIRLLEMSPNNQLVASAAADNTIRVWNTDNGQPNAHIADIPGAAIGTLAFSPDASWLGVLSGARAVILDVASGDIEVEFELGGAHKGMTFVDNEHLYLGGDNGALRVVIRDNAGNWSMRQLWQGAAAIRLLQASPQGRYLILVDQNNLAQQFSLVEGQIGTMSVRLPDTVYDVAFSPVGSRVLFKTSRWVHRTTSSATGLTWVDALHTPKVLNGARIVFGDAAPTGDHFYVPAAREGSITLVELNFRPGDGPGLFGNKDSLLADWRAKLLPAVSATDP